MQAEVVAIGDEITGGQLLDTNSQWLSQRLAALGIRVLYHSTVGDELDPCVALFRQVIERADIVITTGGLGPTADDLTREALAQAAGRPLQLVPEALDHVRQMFARRKREMPKSNELQAMFPAGSRVVPNPHGTAPGIDLDIPREGRGACRFIALPGVPAEMREMWQIYVDAALRSMGAGQRFIVRRNIKCFGAGESQIESLMPDLIRRDRVPRVGINASGATIILRIVAEGSSEAECRDQIESTVATIHECLGKLVFGEGDDELQDAVVRLLCDRGQTLATVEVATAGLLAQLLGTAATDKQCYRGGIVAADQRAATEILCANESERVSSITSSIAELAEACRRRFHCDLGLAIGEFPEIAKPASENSDMKLLRIALATAAGAQTIEFNYGLHPDIVLIYCAKRALDLVRLRLRTTDRQNLTEKC